MGSLNPLFQQQFKNLAPGTPNPSRVIREQVLYRSGDKSSQPLKCFKGGSMDVDRGDFKLPVDQPEHRLIPKTKPKTKPGTKPGTKPVTKPVTKAKTAAKEAGPGGGKIEGIEKTGGVKSIESIGMDEDSKKGKEKKEDKKKVPEHGLADDNLMAFDEQDEKKAKKKEEDDLMALLNDEEEEKKEEEEEDEEDDDPMSMLMGALGV